MPENELAFKRSLDWLRQNMTWDGTGWHTPRIHVTRHDNGNEESRRPTMDELLLELEWLSNRENEHSRPRKIGPSAYKPVASRKWDKGIKRWVFTDAPIQYPDSSQIADDLYLKESLEGVVNDTIERCAKFVSSIGDQMEAFTEEYEETLHIQGIDDSDLRNVSARLFFNMAQEIRRVLGNQVARDLKVR